MAEAEGQHLLGGIICMTFIDSVHVAGGSIGCWVTALVQDALGNFAASTMSLHDAIAWATWYTAVSERYCSLLLVLRTIVHGA